MGNVTTFQAMTGLINSRRCSFNTRLLLEGDLSKETMDYRIKARKTIIRRDRCCGFPSGSQSISHSISERRWREADYTEFISIEARHARLPGGGFSLCAGGARATSPARFLKHRKQTCARTLNFCQAISCMLLVQWTGGSQPLLKETVANSLRNVCFFILF